MSFLAANLAQEMNGVSWLHGEVSKEIFKGMWPGYMAEELHISYVTNGVHYPTWAAPEWKKIEESLFGEDFKNHHYDKKCFEQIYTVPDAVVYEVRTKLRKRLIDHVKELLKDEVAASYFTPRQVIQIRETLRDDILTIGFGLTCCSVTSNAWMKSSITPNIRCSLSLPGKPILPIKPDRT